MTDTKTIAPTGTEDEVIAQQVTAWRREQARLQDLINTATGTAGTEAGFDLDSLTRYEPEISQDGYGLRSTMSEYPGCGDYVKFDDVAALIALARRAAPDSAAQPVQAGEAVELPELPHPLEIDWPQLHSEALGCGVEDRGIRDRYEAAEYGWQVGMEAAAERVPELIYDEETVLAIQREAYELGRASLAPVSAQQGAAEQHSAVECDSALRAEPAGAGVPSPTMLDWSKVSAAAQKANREFGQWMPERWVQIFVNAYNKE